LKRKQARDNFREKIVAMRENLNQALTTSLDHETKQTIGRMEESIAPYMRFIKAEIERITTAEGELTGLQKDLSTLRAKIEAVVK
jgi:hypothetical protein